MNYYHGSPTGGLTMLRPGKPDHFDKPRGVYLTSLYPMALQYGIRNFEYTYGYTRDKRLYFEEYFPNALEELYGGKRGVVYVCSPGPVEGSRIPNEWISMEPVEIVETIEIPDLMEELLCQEALGTMDIHRYADRSSQAHEWTKKAEAQVILDKKYLETPGPGADYMKKHYPESWALALELAGR